MECPFGRSIRTALNFISETVPLFTSGKIRLIDDKRMIAQFAALERRPQPSGKDNVNHPANEHDDLANVVAGAAVLAVSAARGASVNFVSPVIIPALAAIIPLQPTHRRRQALMRIGAMKRSKFGASDMTTLEKAEAIRTKLEAKLFDAKNALTEMDRTRISIAFAAHTGGDGAKIRSR